MLPRDDADSVSISCLSSLSLWTFRSACASFLACVFFAALVELNGDRKKRDGELSALAVRRVGGEDAIVILEYPGEGVNKLNGAGSEDT